eukprot:jgi/Mesvir1/23772/Mv10598-RA.2
MLLWRHLLASRSSPRRHMPPGMTAWLANLTRIPFTRRSVSQLVDICLLCAERSTERLLGCFGPLFVLLAVAILAPWLVAAKVVTACWMLLNVTLNYVLCIVTRPGASPDIKDMGPNAAAMLQGCTTTMKKSGRWCKKCKKPKPPLSHHCSICRQCILKMDHHCPWMHNCVGYFNYRFFFLFVFWTWVGCAYGVWVFAEPFLEMALVGGNHIRITLSLAFVLCIAIFLMLTFLLGWHVYLVLTAQTTVEFYCNRVRIADARAKNETWVNRYDLGWARNWQEVFVVVGLRWWWLRWMLPSWHRQKGDGCVFPTVPGMENDIEAPASGHFQSDAY